jgi:hypothetical protein
MIGFQSSVGVVIDMPSISASTFRTIGVVHLMVIVITIQQRLNIREDHSVLGLEFVAKLTGAEVDSHLVSLWVGLDSIGVP